jgi:hypothetical protein
LCWSEAIFATDLDDATPAETVRPDSARTATRIFRAISSALPNRRALSVTSRNASSKDRGSTSGVKRRKISKIRSETSLYRSIRTGRKTPWGQSRAALAIGSAECTPNFRAS